MSAATELAWAAGFFDGEGSTTTGKHVNARGITKFYIRMTMEQAGDNPDPPQVLTRFRAAVKGGTIHGPYQSSRTAFVRRPMWGWRASGSEVYRILNLLLPYMGEVKIQQANRAIDKVDTNSQQTAT
jgi:hypothetical protein